MANENQRKPAGRDKDQALDEILRETEHRPRRPRPDGERQQRPDGERQQRPDGERRQRPDGERRQRPDGERRQRPDGERRQRPDGERRQRPDGERRQRPDGERRQRPEGERRQRPDGERRQRPDGERRSRPEREIRQEERRRRPAAERNLPEKEASAATRAHSNTQQKKKSSGKSTAATKNSNSIFPVALLLYIVIFFVVTLFLMHRLWNYLGEYESSLPQYTIDGYVTSLSGGFYGEMVRQKVDEIALSKYETADTVAATLEVEEPEGEKRYTWSKKADAYTDDHPVYYIRYGNAAIATVALERISGTEKFNFPVWRTLNPVSLIEIATTPAYELELTVPDGASVIVNGQAADLTPVTDGSAGMTLDDVSLEYTEAPAVQRAEISGLYVSPEVRAFDAQGNPLEAREIPDETVTHQVYVFDPMNEAAPDPALKERMEELTRAYINYMINKDEATWANLNYLDNFLVRNGAAFEKLHSMTQDVAWNNPYTAREDRVLEVSHFKNYSDTVFTFESHFELQLTKNVVNDYIGTVRWTMVKTGDTWNAADFELVQISE